MNSLIEVIASYYDQLTQDEWERLERHRMEFALTLRALEAYLPPPPANILDCGSGPGRYAIELARRGYRVTLFDLSPENLRMAAAKAQEAGVSLAAFEQGTATDLSRFQVAVFDAVLLMGPLYHLLELEERQQALAEAGRVLKPGGPLFTAFITRYAAHRDIARRFPSRLLEDAGLSESILSSGKLPPRGEGGKEFIAYLAHPSEISPLFQNAGFEVLSVLGVEGIVSMIDEQVNALTGEAWERWVELNDRLASDPAIHGCVEHLLVISVKPGWRDVLLRIAPRMEETGLDYKVVGGASVVLQGIPLHVKDIDIEMSAEGVYRFQELFPGQVVNPVVFSESETYRSHFGRFDFEGVTVEIMGDLQRREGENWVPTATSTQGTVELDGISVKVSWLEEEVLAYIRRGRLERAAQCLPYCKQERLLALLRGEQGTNVI